MKGLVALAKDETMTLNLNEIERLAIEAMNAENFDSARKYFEILLFHSPDWDTGMPWVYLTGICLSLGDTNRAAEALVQAAKYPVDHIDLLELELNLLLLSNKPDEAAGFLTSHIDEWLQETSRVCVVGCLIDFLEEQPKVRDRFLSEVKRQVPAHCELWEQVSEGTR